MNNDESGRRRGFPKCSKAHGRVGRPRPRGMELVVGEPFRVFFPAGILVGVYGVSLWPMLYAGWLRFHPGVPHARLMVLGFLGAFVMGFLGTALPRMLSAARLRVWELAVLLGLYGGAVLCEAGGKVFYGDMLFLAAFVFFLGSMLVRWVWFRKESAPVEFAVALAGMVCGVVGIAGQMGFSGGNPWSFWPRLSALLIYHGFTVLPVLGIGRFLAPRILEGEEAWRRERGRAAVIWAAGAVLVSLVVEAWGAMRWASGLRLAVVGWYFWSQTAAFRRTGAQGTLAFAMRVSVWSLVASYGFGVFWPELRIGVEHIAFVSGLGLMALTVAARVTLGHSGNSGQFKKGSRVMRWIVWLALLAMSTRVSADYFPKIMVSHHNYAALLWSGVAVLWLIWLFPKLLAGDPEEEG